MQGPSLCSGGPGGRGGIIAWLWEVATDIRGNFNGRCARAEGESQPESSGRVIDRALILRGFIECGLKRGAWRLTALGVKVAKVLHPEARPLSKREVARTIA
jgi:hypothetical protein